MENENRNTDNRVMETDRNQPPVRTDMHLRRPLRVSDIVHGLRKYIKTILICAAVGLVLGIILSIVSYLRGEMSKQYAIKTTIGFTSQDQKGQFIDDRSSPSNTDIYLAEDMTDAVIYVLKSDLMLNKVIESTDLLGVSARSIYDNLQPLQYKETQIIELTLYWRSAQEGVMILEALNRVAPEVLVETLKLGSVTVINAPSARYVIGGNLNLTLWGFMMAIGAVFGLGFAVLDLMIKPTLLSSDDMEKEFRIEVLGEIPENKKYFRQKRNPIEEYEDDEANADVLDNFMSVAQTVKIRIRKMEHPCIFLTSPTQNEGNTTVAAYLAAYLSNLGLKVLLADFDTKNPTLGGIFLSKVEYENSINALYRGECSKEEAITRLTGKLDILPAILERKPLPIDSALMDMVNDFKADYDVVLIDTAPIGQAAGTMNVSEIADLCLLVVRYDAAEMYAIREAINRIDKSGTRIMGCVINGVRNFWGSHSDTRNEKEAAGSPKAQERTRKKSVRKQEWEDWELAHAETEETKE